MAAAFALAEILPRIEGSRDILSLNFDNDTARTFYSAVADGMIAFTGLVVSIAVVVVQFGASQYTPRLVFAVANGAALAPRYGSSYERLVQVKAAVDPDDRFRLTQGIRAPG